MSNVTTDNLDETFMGTLVIETADSEPLSWRSLLRSGFELFTGAWSATGFPEPELTQYAERLMLEETRRGITLLAIVSLLIQAVSAGLYQQLGIHASVLYTYGLLAMLSLHVVISARCIHDTNALNLLGTLLLVITAVAIMSIAHRSGTLNAGLLASVVLLFMVLPLVPWGLRESLVVVVLTYSIFTASALSVTGRFQAQELWTMQFLIIAAAFVATMIVVRATAIRKQNICTQYELEQAHMELQLLSTRDPLTGAWNRRYLDQNFNAIAKNAYVAGNDLYIALLDVDNFKELNDTFGHHHGDEILRRLVHVLQDNLSGTAHVLRLGGDEFAVIDTGKGFEESIRRCLEHLETDPHLLQTSEVPVRVSTGFAKVEASQVADLDRLYQAADKALYKRKNARQKHQSSGAYVAYSVD